MWTVVTTIPPESEALSADDVRAQSRLDVDDGDDALIERYIAAAREAVENICGIRIGAQSVSMTTGAFADFAALPVAPVTAISEIQYRDAAGGMQTLSADVYALANGAGLRPSIRLKAGQSWPQAASDGDAITVSAAVGYSDPPEAILHAMLLTIASWHADREAGDIPEAAMSLLVNYR